MENRINYTRNGNRIQIESTFYGDQLCENVLDSAEWAESVGSGEYLINDAEEMDALLEFIDAFNNCDFDAEDLTRAINDWTLLICFIHTKNHSLKKG